MRFMTRAAPMTFQPLAPVRVGARAVHGVQVPVGTGTYAEGLAAGRQACLTGGRMVGAVVMWPVPADPSSAPSTPVPGEPVSITLTFASPAWRAGFKAGYGHCAQMHGRTSSRMAMDRPHIEGGAIEAATFTGFSASLDTTGAGGPKGVAGLDCRTANVVGVGAWLASIGLGFHLWSWWGALGGAFFGAAVANAATCSSKTDPNAAP